MASRNDVDPISAGHSFFACKTPGDNNWKFAREIDNLRAVAARAARSIGAPVPIFRAIRPAEETQIDTYLIIRRLRGSSGGHAIEWSIVDTEEAAKMLRDVSCGPTPYFPLTREEVIQPS